MSTTRTLAAALAIAALAAPAAQAQPADMHASLAQAAAKAQQNQDLRSPDARDAGTVARHPRSPGHAVNAPGATAVDSATRPAMPGPPTWLTKPITAGPAAEAADAGNGIDWTTIGLGIAGSLLAVSGLAVLNRRRDRRTRRARAAA